jgi:hypothetical protein
VAGWQRTKCDVNRRKNEKLHMVFPETGQVWHLQRDRNVILEYFVYMSYLGNGTKV